MNGKGFKSSNLAIAIATTLAVSGAVTPAQVYARTSMDAIVGTGHSKSVSSDAIIGTGKGKRAIIGTGADAIIGTGADAIIGTGADAIIGTGRSKSVSSDAIIGTGKAQVLMLGAIDSFDSARNTITVLGRTLKMPSVTRVEEAHAAGQQLFVAVSGRISASGAIEQMKLRFMPTEYVAGSSKVVVSGRVSGVNANVGTMTVGGVTVDLTSAIAPKAPTEGSLVILVGTQPARQGIVIADQLYVK